jgi:hypothetical protein
MKPIAFSRPMVLARRSSRKTTTLSFLEFMRAGTARYGPDIAGWKFRCPVCGHVQSINDFRPFKDQGATADDVRFNCLGRFLPTCRKAFGGNGPGPCDYTTGGLFNVTPLTIKTDTGPVHSFDFADQPLAPRS